MDFTDAESRMIGAIMKAERTMPDDFFCVPAVQELACLLVKLQPLLPEKDFVMLVGIGAVVARQGKNEMKADIEATMAIARARSPRP